MGNKIIALFNTPSDTTTNEPTRYSAYPYQRVLVVEADAASRAANAHVLASSGYVVDAVEDGVAGWESIQTKDFDLLITDHDLPRLSGLDLVKRVRFARLPLPIILASAAIPEEELTQHPWLQLAATLPKPFSPVQLLETARAAMRAPCPTDIIPDTWFPLRVLAQSDIAW